MKQKAKTQRRRKRERKTDYKKRLNLLKSGKPRVVTRITNRYVDAQYVESDEAQDKVIFEVTSKDLMKYGWPQEAKGSLKSIPASYLTGYLMGKEIGNKKLDTPILDVGMARMIQNSRLFALIKGLIDSGIEIKCDEKHFPKEEKINGKFMKNPVDIGKIKSNIDKK